MTTIPPHNLCQEIREKVVTEDYAFNDATIEEINDLLIEFLTEHAYEGVFREQANKTARDQAWRLATALEACRSELQNSLANAYVSIHLREYYGEQLIQKYGDEEVAYDMAAHLAALFEELEKLTEAAKAVAARSSLDVEGLPTFSKGRGESRDKLMRLVSGLYAIACRYCPSLSEDMPDSSPDSSRERFEIIQELLSIALPNVPTIKTLRNMLSDSRSQK